MCVDNTQSDYPYQMFASPTKSCIAAVTNSNIANDANAFDAVKDIRTNATIQQSTADVQSVERPPHALPTPNNTMPSILYMDLMQVIETYGEECIVIPTVQFDCILTAVTIAVPTATPDYIQKYEKYNNSRKI